MTLPINPNETKPADETKPETKPADETKPVDKKPEVKPEPVRHHVLHDNGGDHHKGDDAPTAIAKWAMAGLAVVLFIALTLGLAWSVSSYMNKAPAMTTIAPPAPPPRMVDVSPPDPTIVYAPTPAPVPDPLYVPTVRKHGKDKWGNSIVTKPTFAEGSK